MPAYYNEFKPEAAHMLRQLIRDGLIADGEVDERSITEVTSDDIKGFTQCHFFAGIGGWSVALRLAGWDDTRPVWTGSCPCQPFSSAGKQKGKADERHLWPVWAKLIRECRPARIYGEQVASAIAHGWWDDVADDLEAEGYAVGAAVLPACSVGRPHKRDRLWFVADASVRDDSGGSRGDETPGPAKWIQERHNDRLVSDSSNIMADTLCIGLEGQSIILGGQATGSSLAAGSSTGGNDNTQWATFGDGKKRQIEPSICLLAHGVQHRAPILHAFGNAIVPQVAAEFIKATY